MSDWSANEQGLWCNSCGNLVASAREAREDDFVEPESCRQCGFPDIEAVADYHCGDDDDDHGEPDFDCGRMPDGTCGYAGTEWCDWECPHS